MGETSQVNYHEYLQSKLWKQRRLAKLENAKHRCAYCGEKEGLQVHHKNYDNLGNENTKDLIVLCQSCHWIADQKRKNPSFKLPGVPVDLWDKIDPLPPEFDLSRIPVHARKSQF